MEKNLTRFLTLTIFLCFGATTLLANAVKISGRLLFSRAVSYTHLDVYKRQAADCSSGGWYFPYLMPVK